MPYCPSHCRQLASARCDDPVLAWSQGFETAKKATLLFLETFKDKIKTTDREVLLCVARTSLRTKLYQDLADQLTDIVVDAVLTIRKEDEPLDLYMVSWMQSGSATCDLCMGCLLSCQP